MLEPGERTLLRKALEPPDGYRLDHAIGTTFSLDLVALLTAPLAFTSFDRGADDGEREQSLALLESLRRYAKRIAVFCQVGRIAFPRAQYPQFAWLERTVFQCRTPRGLFHPKVWVLRYTNADKVTYRALCMSRNLTIANSWDTLLALDGEPRSGGRFEVDPQPLADFVAALPTLAQGVTKEVRARIEAMAREIRSVAFVPPQGFTSCEFRPMGIEGYTGWPFSSGAARSLVISPFLGAQTLERIAQGGSSCALISSPDALAHLEERPRGFDQFWTFDDDAMVDLPPNVDEATSSAGDELVELTGLHAKAYIFEQGRNAEVWTGSANATARAFDGNVEFMVRLTGPKERAGIDLVMKPVKDSLRLVDLLKDAGDKVGKSPRDAVQTGLDAQVESVRQWLSNRTLTAAVTAAGAQFDLVLEATDSAPTPMPPGTTVTCWPVSVGEALARRVEPGLELARFERISLEGLSSFIAFKITAREQDAKSEVRFVLNVPLIGAPADREERLLRVLLSDRARLVRFLTLLLSDDGAPPDEFDGRGAPAQGHEAAGTPAREGAANGMFELLVRALAQAPERLDDIAALLRDIHAEKGGDDMFPEQFEEIWRPIWAARCNMPPCAKS